MRGVGVRVGVLVIVVVVVKANPPATDTLFLKYVAPQPPHSNRRLPNLAKPCGLLFWGGGGGGGGSPLGPPIRQRLGLSGEPPISEVRFQDNSAWHYSSAIPTVLPPTPKHSPPPPSRIPPPSVRNAPSGYEAIQIAPCSIDNQSTLTGEDETTNLERFPLFDAWPNVHDMNMNNIYHVATQPEPMGMRRVRSGQDWV